MRLYVVMDESAFGEMFGEAPLRQTLVAWYGPTLGRSAAQHALEWAGGRTEVAYLTGAPDFGCSVGDRCRRCAFVRRIVEVRAGSALAAATTGSA